MPTISVWHWCDRAIGAGQGRWLCQVLVGLVCSAVLAQGCRPPEPHAPDITPPRTFAVPAGGIYRTLPTQIQLLTEAGATLFYRWEDGQEQQYTGPVRVPDPTTGPLTLHYWAQDAAGNKEPWRREHYVLDSRAAPVEILVLDRPVLGPAETATLQWRSTAADATYEIAVTANGWGAGRRVASGQVVPGEIQQTSIPGTALRPGVNRLWLRVQSRAGETGATSRLLLCHATPATTRAWPATGVFGSPQTVQLFNERQATVYYTTDGSEPTLDATPYTAPLRFETSTRLRYFSLDAYGNREAPREERYEIHPQVPTITLQTISGFEIESEAQVVFTWQSDTAGHYDVTLSQQADKRQLTVLQGKVEPGHDMRSIIARNFLTPGDWQVLVQVHAASGQTGQLSFWLQVRYVERFVDTRYLDTAATTAAWDTTQRHVRLTRGPRLLGTYDTRGRSRQVVTRGAYAFLANGSGGLHLVDVSNPQQPQRAGVWYPHGKAAALAKYGPYVYLAASGSGVTIIDVAQPASPRLVGTVPLRGSAADIVIVPPYAYVGTTQGLLYIFDLTTPLRPSLLGQVEVEGRVVDMAIADGIAYVACLKQGLVMVDVHQPQHPRLLHRWPTAEAATGIAVYEQRAYVAAGALEILDVRRPQAPVRAAIHRLPGTYGVAVLPPYVLVASGTDGVQVVPLDGSQPTGQTRTAHYAARLAVTGHWALVADTQGGLRIVDLAPPEQPRLLAGLEDIGTIVDVVVDGSFAYLADDQHGSGIVVVDISIPTTPRVVGRYHNEATSAVVVWEQFALVGDEAGHLHLVEVQQPSQPRVLASLALPGAVQQVALLLPYALVASDDAGLHVVEITPDHLLQRRATVPMAGRALDIALVQDTAYVAAASGGIQVVDVSMPHHPRLGSPYHHSDGKGDEVIRLLAHQQHLYALDSERGVQIFTGAETGRLQWHGSFTGLDGAPWALTAVGPYLFITTLLNSLYVMDVTVPAQPRLLSTAPYGGAGVHATGQHLYIAVRGRRGVPGGLQVVEAFASVSPDAMQRWRARGVPVLAEETTFLVNRANTFNAPGSVQSTVLSALERPVLSALLQVEDFWGSTGHIRYELSNDGGTHWQQVQPGEAWHFAAPGTDLRWRAILRSTDLATTPTLEALRIEYTTGSQTHP